MHYYQFNIGDYKSHTDYLSPIEDLAFRRMLDWCYLHEKPLPPTAKEVARKIGLRDYVCEVELVLADFFTKTDDGYVNNRINEEIDGYKAKADSARNNGKKGGRPRKETQEEPKITQPVNLANPAESESQAKHKPLTINQEPLTNNQLKEVGAKAKRFVPPTLTQVLEYCNERLNHVDANKFIDHYTSNGWLVGKNKMKDWKAAVRTWEKSSFDKPKQQSNNLQVIQDWRPPQ